MVYSKKSVLCLSLKPGITGASNFVQKKLKMKGEPEYHRLKEYPDEQVNPNQQGYPTQLGYPPAYVGNQPIGFEPSNAIMEQERHSQPEDYIGLSIFVLICCCFPAGIVGLIKSCEAKNRFIAGDYDGAMEASKYARIWARGGLLFALLFIVSYTVATVVVALLTRPTNE
ncbi:Proline-rich transmembrane protein 1 [Holothuria leucospilota]|uniref:Proline-rich transmembrane protein 1 n=1 Tax=Holothuria leucospilota TaxID=206669 RepID=A0A9Q1CSU1_HOLLE|nr:Proline-rich transmembrane protein 1 [Holothuria leucospilota]